MNGPGIRRAIPNPDRETLRVAIAAMATQAVVIAKLRASVAERDALIAELQAMLFRSVP